MKWLADYDLSGLNTFAVPATARFAAVLESQDDYPVLEEKLAKHPDLPVLVLGGGSNILLLGDFNGIVVHVCTQGRQVEKQADSHLVMAQAGENWHEFVRWTIASGLGGLENLSLIPGTVGAAPIQNIGAYGLECCERLAFVKAWDRQIKEFQIFEVADCGFAYRDSIFKQQSGRWLIAEVGFKLPLKHTPVLHYAGLTDYQFSTDTPSPLEISDVVCQIRRSKLPDPEVLGNAGSFFKNPIIDSRQAEQLKADYPGIPLWPVVKGFKTSAAWLIDQAGWKGHREGAVGVSSQHALVLVNHGGGTGQEIWTLAQSIQASIVQQFGIRLVPEPNVIASNS